MVGAKGEARGTEAHFHGEAEGQAGVGGTEQECAGMAGGPLPSGMSGGGVWSRRGVWGNALVRDRGGDVDAVPDRRKAARPVTHLKVSHGNQVTLKATREQENWEAVGGMRNPALAVARVPGLRDAGRRVRRCLLAGTGRVTNGGPHFVAKSGPTFSPRGYRPRDQRFDAVFSRVPAA